MVSAVGRLVTSFTAKFGICSQEAAVRLATETGQKLIDKSANLGRNLTVSEISDVFASILPKKLRPQILESREEVVKQLTKRGMKNKDAEEFMANPEIFGIALTTGRKKAPMFADRMALENLLGKENLVTGNSLIAHELEHAIEFNNRIGKILNRKIFEPINLMFKKDKAAYLKQINNDSVNFQTNIQMQAQLPKEEQNAAIKSVIENLSEGSNKKQRMFKRILNLEIPAYTTGYNVEQYGARKFGSAMMFQGIVSSLYKNALNILKG